MKSLITYFFAILPALTFAHQHEVTTSVDSAIIFTEDAQLSRSRYLELEKGENTVRFIKLEQSIKPNSIQLFGTGGNKSITIVSTQFLKEATPKKNVSKIILQLKDSLKILNTEMTALNNRLHNLQQEKELIISHAKVDYHVEVDYINLIKSLAEYYRESTNEIDRLILSLEYEKKQKMDMTTALQIRMDEQSRNQYMGVIEAKVYASKPVKQKLTLTYMVSGVSWTPFYDIKSKGVLAPLDVSCKATITQNTNIDWKGVYLTLSTRKPITLGTIPKVHPWILHFQQSLQTFSRSNTLIDQAAISNSHLPISTPSNLNQTIQSAAPTNYINKFQTATHKMINKEYRSTLKYNVSGNKGVAVVELDDFEMAANYTYYTVPKYDQHVYLIAEVENCEQYDLIPAFANIFLEGIYIGKLFINPETIRSSMELMLGKDPDILVDRRKINQASEKKRKITNSIETTTIEIELLVKNRKQKKIAMTIKDQVPVSSHADIVVDILKTSKAELDSTSGTLTWHKDFSPKSSEKYTIKYDVKYPKNKRPANF